MVKYHHPYLVKQSGIVKLVQRRSMSSLNTHNVSIIIQSRESLPRHVPKRLSRFLLAKKAGTTFQTVYSIYVESGSSQGIQFHRFGIGIAVYAVLVSHLLLQYLFTLLLYYLFLALRSFYFSFVTPLTMQLTTIRFDNVFWKLVSWTFDRFAFTDSPSN